MRTPKFNGAARSAVDPALAQRRWLVPPGSIEVLLGVLMGLSFLAAFARPYTLMGAPFLLLFACGYLVIGVPQLKKS